MKKNKELPHFASNLYSAAHKSVYDEGNKKRLAKQIHSVIKDFLKDKSTKKLSCLDVGCSAGTITYNLSSLFFRIIGIDVDTIAISRAKNNYKKKNLRYLFASGERIPFKESSYDVVICHEVYSYLEYPNLLLREIFRVLKPGGICFFTADNLLFPIENQYKLPLLLYLPDSLAKVYLRILGYSAYYLGHYKTYWQLKRLFKNFIVHNYTGKILRNPEKYKFVRLYKYKKIANTLPDYLLSTIIPFMPTFIWILEKPKTPLQ